MALSAGARLGPYEILSGLGSGGMGEVYRARDTKLERDVAIKILPSPFAADSDRLARFEREARLLASLNHPHIGAIYGVEETAGVTALVLELVEGETLENKIAGPKAHAAGLPLADVLAIARQIAGALEAAHERGIVHRDLKPANIKITPDGVVKVLDFGLAKSGAESGVELTHSPTMATPTVHGVVMGTAPYMSPEQARGKAVDKRTDIWAFGCVLYEMLTGRAAFAGETVSDTIAAILEREPDWRALPDGAPPGVRKLLERCLKKDRKQRLHDAADARLDIEEALVDLGRAERGGVADRARPSPPRWRRAFLWSSLGAVALLLLGVAVWTAPTTLQLPGQTVARWLGRPVRGRIGSLAVLPLANLSGDPEQEYFADGMTDALIADLGKIGALRVISRTSAMQYRGAKQSLPEIGRALQVDAIVEGTVLRAGDRVRITAQLIDAPTENHLWVETYERDIRNVLDLQRDVARAIASEIQIKVTPQEQASFEHTRPASPKAYEAFLKGQYYFNKRTEEGLRKSIEYFDDAIHQDPGSAIPYIGLADAYGTLAYTGYAVLDPREAMPKARAAAQKALTLDGRSAEAFVMLAYVAENYDWDRNGAENLFRRGLDLNRNYARGHQSWAWFLAALGRHEEAHQEIEKARELDPLSLIIGHNVGWLRYFARRFDQAIEQYRRVLEMDQNFPAAHLSLGQAYVQQGLYAEGIAEEQKALTLGSSSTVTLASLGYAHAVSGNRAAAQKILEELIARSRQRHVPGYWIAVVYAGLGDTERSFAWLDKAYEERQGQMVTLNVDPFFDTLRSDRRFADLIRRIGFVE